MNNKKEPIKDFLYNSIDFLLIIIIVAAVIGVISWRVNIMFNSSTEELTEDISDSKDLSEKKNSNEEPIDNIDKSEEDGGSEVEDKKAEAVADNKDLDEDNLEDIKLVDFTIPEGSVSTDIAQLLKDAKLIENPDDFTSKCEDMNLSTSLRSGSFEIPSNSSIEEILKIITK